MVLSGDYDAIPAAGARENPAGQLAGGVFNA
jgi:hypothetical protein